MFPLLKAEYPTPIPKKAHNYHNEKAFLKQLVYSPHHPMHMKPKRSNLKSSKLVEQDTPLTKSNPISYENIPFLEKNNYLPTWGTQTHSFHIQSSINAHTPSSISNRRSMFWCYSLLLNNFWHVQKSHTTR